MPLVLKKEKCGDGQEKGKILDGWKYLRLYPSMTQPGTQTGEILTVELSEYDDPWKLWKYSQPVEVGLCSIL